MEIFMNERIQKYKAEYEKNKQRIHLLQEKNKRLLAKIAQLENEEIIGLVRDSQIGIEGLAELLAKSKKQPTINYDLEEKPNEIQE